MKSPEIENIEPFTVQVPVTGKAMLLLLINVSLSGPMDILTGQSSRGRCQLISGWQVYGHKTVLAQEEVP